MWKAKYLLASKFRILESGLRSEFFLGLAGLDFLAIRSRFVGPLRFSAGLSEFESCSNTFRSSTSSPALLVFLLVDMIANWRCYLLLQILPLVSYDFTFTAYYLLIHVFWNVNSNQINLVTMVNLCIFVCKFV